MNDDPRYTIKMITAEHFDYPILTGDGLPPGQQPVMNFLMNRSGNAAARKVKAGDRAIVYAASPIKGFVWAIEYLGPAAETSATAEQWWAPIKFLVRRSPHSALSISDTFRETGFEFKPNSFPEKQITPDLFHAIKALLGREAEESASSLEDTAGNTNQLPVADSLPEQENVVLDPLLNNPRILGMLSRRPYVAERQIEDYVKQILMELGFPELSIQFQVGRVDICAMDTKNQPVMVVEVKRSIDSTPKYNAARRQAQGYAEINGARYILVTDADRILIYDLNRKGNPNDLLIADGFLSRPGSDINLLLNSLREIARVLCSA